MSTERQNYAMEGRQMNKVESYHAYLAGFYERPKTGKGADEAKTAKAKETDGAAKSGKVTLSDDAKNLLKELQKKYGNMDFIVADYETDEEAERYLSRGTGEYSVLLTPEELEKMAADADCKDQNLKTLDDAVSKLAEMKGQLGDKGQEVSRIGVAIGGDGEISYFAELEKVSEKQRERIEKRREDNREEAHKEASEKAEEKFGRKAPDENREPIKRTIVRAESVEGLLKQIEQVDWSAVKEKEEQLQGRRFDFTV